MPIIVAKIKITIMRGVEKTCDFPRNFSTIYTIEI